MATVDGTSNGKKAADVGPADEVRRWIEYAAGEAAEVKRSALAAADSATSAARSGLSQFLSAASVAVQESKDLMELMKSQYAVHEDMAVAKIKEGIFVAASHPELSCGVAAGVGLVTLKRPRHFLIRNTRRLFMSEESLLSSAEGKVTELRQSINLVKNESKKLEERARKAEEEMERGRQALIKEGRGIQSELRFVSRIEREAMGLKDAIREFPRRDASRFRSEIWGKHKRIESMPPQEIIDRLAGKDILEIYETSACGVVQPMENPHPPIAQCSL